MKTLCILAHADDEVLSCGGLIRQRVDAGHRVHVMEFFGRTYNYGHGDQHWKEQQEDRRKAQQILGYQVLFDGCAREGEPHTHSYYHFLDMVESVLHSYEPDEVVVHAPVDLNQDHRWLAEICRIALRPANLGSVKRILQCFGVDGRLDSSVNFYLPLTESQMQVKLLAMACYQRESRVDPHPRSPENLRAYHRLVGSQCGELYAEPYALLLHKELSCESASQVERDSSAPI